MTISSSRGQILVIPVSSLITWDDAVLFGSVVVMPLRRQTVVFAYWRDRHASDTMVLSWKLHFDVNDNEHHVDNDARKTFLRVFDY